jgi:hypothetical protein
MLGWAPFSTSKASKSSLISFVSLAVAAGLGSMRNSFGSAWVAPVVVSAFSSVSEPSVPRAWFSCTTAPGQVLRSPAYTWSRRRVGPAPPPQSNAPPFGVSARVTG